MAPLTLTTLSPLLGYLDETTGGSKLAARPASLDGKVLGLLPNWRPSAVHVLRAVSILLEKRYRLKAVVMEQPLREPPPGTKVLDSVRGKLDDIARRIDVLITATGD